MRSGDVANWLALFATAGFFLAVAANELNYLQLFSAAWSADGFCISNKDKDPMLQSHALCFYGDTAAAVLLWFTLRWSQHQAVAPRIVETLKPGVFGIFAVHDAYAVCLRCLFPYSRSDKCCAASRCAACPCAASAS